MRAAHLVVAALCAAPLGATEPIPHPQVFSSEARVVNLTISAVGSNGKNLADLELPDFLVYEAGQEQTLDPQLFSHQTLPLDLTFLCDRSKSMTDSLPTARKAAISFLKNLRPKDEAQVVTFGRNTQTLQEFTSDRTALEGAIKSITAPDNNTQLRTALYTLAKEFASRPPSDERRRIIVMVTDGQDTGSPILEDQTVSALQTANVTIIAIELPTGVITGSFDTEADRAHEMLDRITKATGGILLTIQHGMSFSLAYNHIAQELRSQYRIGYRPSQDALPGTWREIIAYVHRPNVTVRCRNGYYVPKSN